MAGNIFYTKERLEPAVRNATSMPDLIKSLGRKDHSLVRQRIRKYIKQYGLSDSHLKRIIRTPAERRAQKLIWATEAINRNIQFLVEYLKTHSCIDCDESNPLVLEFDHVRGKKLERVSSLVSTGKSLKSIKAEIAKCEVRCANCHRIKTAHQLNYKMLQYL